MDKTTKFEKLAKPIINDLYKHIKCIVKDPVQVDDIFQDSLRIAYEKLETLRDETKFKSWIFKIASRASFGMLKKYRKETLVDEFFDGVQALKDEETAEAFIIHEENKESVMKAIKILSYEQRRLIIMIYYLELNYKEISELLPVSVNALRVQHHRALKRLRDILKGEYDG